MVRKLLSKLSGLKLDIECLWQEIRNIDYPEPWLEDCDRKHIWGIVSCDDLTGNEANLYTMNDISLTYQKKEKKYTIGVETIYWFEAPDGKTKYISSLLDAFTKWMESEHYDTNFEPTFYDMFTAGVNINSQFDSIEEAYGAFKMLAKAYIGGGSNV